MNLLFATLMQLAAEGDFGEISDALKDLIGQMWVPCIAVASALTVVWGVYLGIKFWSAGGDEQKKKSAKSAVISFVVGIIIIFVAAVGAPMLIAALTQWYNDSSASALAAMCLYL